MKQENINYLLVGSLVISMASVLGIIYLKLSGDGKETDRYYALYSNIAGVTEGTTVTYGGYQIGMVKKIEFEQKENKTVFKLSLDVLKDWKIPSDSQARIVSSGLLSDNRIDIVEGNNIDALVPGDMIEAHEAVGLFDAINAVAYELQDLSQNNIKPLLKNVNERFESVSRNFDELSTTLNRSVPIVVEDASMLIKNLNDSADKIAMIFGDKNQNHIDNLFQNADELSNNLKNLTQGLEKSISQFDQVLARTDGILTSNDKALRESVLYLRNTLDAIAQNIDSIVYNLDTTSRNINEFSRQIRENPSAILSGSPPKERGIGSK